ISTIIIGSFLVVGSLYAQDQAQSQEKAFSAPSTNITSADVKKFQAIHPKITDLQKELGQKINKAETPVQARELQAQYQQKMINVLKDKGLSVEKFNAIAQQEATKQ
ncbi:MAG: DUF4168 domain-containing protein, partial [bacterium]